MSFRSTQFLDPRYDDITCESVDCSGTIYTTNLVVTGSVSLPTSQNLSVNNETVQTLLVENSLTCNGTSNLSNTDCSGNLQVNGSTTLGTSLSGSTVIQNPYLYIGSNCNGVTPVNNSGMGCITANYAVGQAEVDFFNCASQYDTATNPAFSFYKLPSTSAIAWIQNNGQINCPLLGCSGTGYFSDVQTTSETATTLNCTTGNITNANVTTLTVNQNNQGTAVFYGGITTNNSGILAYNSLLGSNFDWLGYYLSQSLPSSIALTSSSNFSLYTTLFTFSALSIGVYTCMGSIRFYASAGSTILGCTVEAVQNNNSAIVPFIWNDNFNNGSTLTSNLNTILSVNFTFYNNSNSGTLVLQVATDYSGIFEVLGPQTSYLQLTRIA